jgi:hypothetical protein
VCRSIETGCEFEKDSDNFLMENNVIGVLAFLVAATIFILFRFMRKNEDFENQKILDEHLKKSLTNAEIGTLYERYIGYLHEIEGYDVEYTGAVNGYEDLGRDLIIKKSDEIFIVQTKRWAKSKTIQEKHIFQLYGSMIHFRLVSARKDRRTKAVFYTSAKYSDVARSVAKVLEVELRTLELDNSYPRIKCNVSANGEKIYHFPCHPYYDKIKIEPHKGEFYAKNVKEAVSAGFRRARKFDQAA